MEQSYTQLYDDDTMMKKLIANKVPESIAVELIQFFHLLVYYNSSQTFSCSDTKMFNATMSAKADISSQKTPKKTPKLIQFFHSHASDISRQKTPTWLIESINAICDTNTKGKITEPLDCSAICDSLVLSRVPYQISHEISVLVERVIFGKDGFRIPFSDLRSTLDKFI